MHTGWHMAIEDGTHAARASAAFHEESAAPSSAARLQTSGSLRLQAEREGSCENILGIPGYYLFIT